MGDREALNKVELGNKIESLPGLYCAIGDCAYKPTKRLVPIYGGYLAKSKKNDNFNFFASQLCIQIEMAYGLMVKKWGILRRPISTKVKHIKHVIVAIAQLHNYCINERLIERNGSSFLPVNVEISAYEQLIRDSSAELEFQQLQADFDNTHSYNRSRMTNEVAVLGLQ
jgi:hypothetical protein